MSDVALVKLGGSLITDKSKPFTEKMDVIERLVKEIHEAKKEGNLRIILGHGGGSYPHEPAKKYQTHKGMSGEESVKGLSLVQDAAARLNRIIVKALIDAGENAISVSPSSCTIAEDSRIKEWYTKPLEKYLEYRMLPVVYGDTGVDSKQGFCILSTEELFYHLSKKLNASKIIMCGKTDGVFTADPNTNPNAKHIPEITPKNYKEIEKFLTSSDGIDVTGGMLLKVKRAVDLAKDGIETHIVNGTKPGFLKRALLNEEVMKTVIKA
jgi:isopentenyl phosphate kinase